MTFSQHSTAFMVILYAAGAIIAAATIAALVLIVACRKDTNKAVIADAMFYPMIALFTLWSLVNDTSIVYEIIELTALLGLLSSVSLARIISRGGR